MQAKALSVFLLISLSSAMYSCTFFRQIVGLSIINPTVHLLSIRVDKAEREFLHLKIKMMVQNPNDFAVTLSDIRYNIHLNQEETGDGHYRDKITFPEFSDKEISIPLKISLKNSIGILRNVLLRRQRHLRATFHAMLLFHTQMGPIQLEVTDQKKLI